MKKEKIYVAITNEPERLRAIEILQNAGEDILKDSYIFEPNNFQILCFDLGEEKWGYYARKNKTKITLDELEALLNPKKSNVFIDVQEWIRENDNGFTFTIKQDETPDCFKRLEQHLKNDYPQGTEIKISADKIEINHS